MADELEQAQEGSQHGNTAESFRTVDQTNEIPISGDDPAQIAAPDTSEPGAANDGNDASDAESDASHTTRTTSAPSIARSSVRSAVRSTFSQSLAVEVQEYQQRLEVAPSAIAAFVDFDNADMDVLNNGRYQDEDQAVIDYYEDSAAADFVPLRSVIAQLREGANSLIVSAYLGQNGARSLRRAITHFSRVELRSANLSVGGLLELTKALTGASET